MWRKLNKDTFQIWWAAAGLLTMVFIAIFGGVYEAYPPTTPSGFLLHASTLVAVVGFYLAMLIECVAGHRRHKVLWIIFFFFVPIISAYVYLIATRYAHYRRRTGEIS